MVVKVTIVILVIVASAGLTSTAPIYVPFIPPNTGDVRRVRLERHHARRGGVIFFAYIGFDAVSTAAQEAKKPQRDMPIGIIGSLAICTVLYVLFAHVLTGMVNYTQVQGRRRAGGHVHLDRSHTLAAIGVNLVGIIAGLHLGDPGDAAGPVARVLLHVARRPAAEAVLATFIRSSGRPGAPTCCSWSSSRCSPAFLPISSLGHMTSIGTLLAFVIVCIGVMVMRKTNPDVPRPYRTPLVPLVPILGILVCFAHDGLARPMTWVAAGRLAGDRPGHLLHLRPQPQPSAAHRRGRQET